MSWMDGRLWEAFTIELDWQNFGCFGQLIGSITGRFSGYKPPAEIEPRQLGRVVRFDAGIKSKFSLILFAYNLMTGYSKRIDNNYSPE